MNIYLIKDGQNAGPYSESEVMTRIKSGAYAKTDLAWAEGCPQPVPLIEILCAASSPQPIQADAKFSADELRMIAENYRNLLGVAVCWLVACFIPMPDSVERVCFLVMAGMWIRFGWRLSGALRQNQWVCVVWSLIPLANIYALVRILRAAARTLKSNGIPVGITGADRTALDRLAQQERLHTRV